MKKYLTVYLDYAVESFNGGFFIGTIYHDLLILK